MKLIADSGSTKCDWVMANNMVVKPVVSTEGYNPFYMNEQQIFESLQRSLVPQVEVWKVREIFFYGAGCSNPDKNKILSRALQQTFRSASVVVTHDLLGSARALLGNEPGFAAILGTGTNTAIYDGKNITLNIDSLGHLIGDEGSGCYMGKKLLREYLRNQLDDELSKKVFAYCPMKKDEVFENLFFKPKPNRFVAGFARVVIENKNHPFCEKIIRDSFHDFFENIVSRYPDYKKYIFNCVGSIAFLNKEILEETAIEYGMTFGKIIKSPIDELVKYHLQ